MIERYYEAFHRVSMAAQCDGAGAADWELTTGEAFFAGLCGASSAPITAAEQREAKVSAVLLHPRGVTLRCGDMIRRECDGAVFRVLSDSADSQTPDHSALNIARTKVERLVRV